MDDHLLRWLLSVLGPATDLATLHQRYARLHSAKAVALEVLRERRAELLEQPLKVTLSGVVSVDNSINLAAIERQIAGLEDGTTPSPEEPGAGGSKSLLYLRERPRR